MANAQGQVISPAAPGVMYMQAISNFMATGSLAPTLSTPTFRAGSTNTFTTTSAPATLSVPLSASIVTGDLILMCARFNSGLPPNLPPNFSLLSDSADANNWRMGIYWKIATAGDPGSNVSWTHGGSATNIVIATLSYSGVNPAVPGWSTTGTQNNPVTTLNAPIVTTPVASTVVEVFSIVQATSGVTLTGPATQRVQANVGTNAIVVSDQSAVNGSTGTQTATATSAGAMTSTILVLFGAPTGGSVPLGGWTLYDTYAASTSGSIPNVVYRSPGASNNAGTDWFLVFRHSSWTNTQNFQSFVCETYTLAAHTYNAPTVQTSSGFPTGGTPSGATTPPWAQIFSSPNTINVDYSYVYWVNASASTGTSNIWLAANRDGFFMSVLAGAALILCFYSGFHTTLVTNPILTPDIAIGVTNFLGAIGSFTREPGWGNNQYWGNYLNAAFYPSQGFAAAVLGTVNGTAGDMFLANNTAVAARWLAYGNTNRPSNTGGTIRALCPTWVQWINANACAWADTVTEGGDNLVFVGNPATPCWLDTTAA